MSEPASPEWYVAASGQQCPACGGTDLAYGRYDNDNDNADTVTRRWACENCGASWVAVYELTGYEGLTTPGREETP